ncbi:1-deoxy-D-xylulose-5-phosphate reductoisomerase [Candidatus Woesearchaeota archaeon]|nr:1-deoxy-D-xylulose-5-phosphate reductoisomerase [Candidatus Woesearchaeota archaeon]
MKSISVLGSTGSIGTQTLDIVKKYPKEFKIVGLTTNKNILLLKEQIEKFKPDVVSVMDKEKADELKSMADVEVVTGINGLTKVATLNEAETVVTAVVGSVGVIPTINAINAGKDIALANKETLVTAGEIVMDLAKRKQTRIMPVDSEHSAIFQCIVGEERGEVERIILTCSGGPFKEYSTERISNATVKEALSHPTWKMGGKITVDSATLMNKGFEVIEARWLYDIGYDNIDVAIHPQSIVHSMVEFRDRSIKAQLGIPDMKLPILYALSYPKRFKADFPRMNFGKNINLLFSAPDTSKFPCLSYAYESGRAGGVMPAIMNAANEVAVDYFLKAKIPFVMIQKTIRHMMDSFKNISTPDIEEIMETDLMVKEESRTFLDK